MSSLRISRDDELQLRQAAEHVLRSSGNLSFHTQHQGLDIPDSSDDDDGYGMRCVYSGRAVSVHEHVS